MIKVNMDAGLCMFYTAAQYNLYTFYLPKIKHGL